MMEFLTLLIAILASVIALSAQSKLAGLKLEISRLRRDLETALRSRNLAQPSRNETAPTPLATGKAAALKAAEPQKQAPEDGPASKPKPLQPAWRTASTQAPKPVPAKKPRKSFEEALGAQWSVWVGGLALLLGAVFLLRYSIEAGFFTPAMRVIMASVLGLGLLGASEWLHRADIQKGGAQLDETASKATHIAHIPGILAAAGMFALLGAAYASYALYGFLSPMPAFVLLAVLSLGAMALSLRHGPILAALGLAASLVTPLLVETAPPNIYGLYGYLIIIAVAALVVAKRRDWGWLTLLTLASLLGWSLLSVNGAMTGQTMPAWYGFIGLAFAVTVWLAEEPKKLTASYKDTKATTIRRLADLRHTSFTALIWGALAALFMVMLMLNKETGYPKSFTRLDYWLGLSGAGLFFAASFLKPVQRAHVFWGGAVGAWAIWIGLSNEYAHIEIIGLGFALSGLVIFLATRALFQQASKSERPTPNLIWVLFSIAFPLALFGFMLPMKNGPSDTEIALIFLGFAAVNAGLAFLLRGKANLTEHASSFAVGAALLYVTACALALDGMALSLAFMFGLGLCAAAVWKLGDIVIRFLVPAFAGLSAAHTLLLQLPKTGSLSSTLIFNELLIYFALPALLCGGAAWMLEKQKSDLWSEGLKAFALAFAALFVVFQIRHIMNGGQVFANRLGFDELALQILTGFCFTLGGAKIGRQSIDPNGSLERNLLPSLMTGVSLISLFVFAAGLCLIKAPIFNSAELVRGNLALNSLTLGYLLPAIALAGIVWLGRCARPQWYNRLCAALCAIALVMFITSMIRFGFKGADISLLTSLPKGVELYAISAAWLALGIGALVVGVKTDRQDVRLASAVLITLTVLKAFLIDMASLEGVLRAMSFVVLGLVLIVIGRVYQRVLMTPKNDVSI